MNFKTTLILLAVLLGLGAFIFFSKSSSEGEKKTETEATANERKLFDVQSTDVTKIAVTPADGKRMVLERSGGTWKLTEPVQAAAETFEVDSLARALAELKSHAKVKASSQDAAATGLANPRYKIEFTAKEKNYSLSVGDKSAVGDNLYVTTTDARNADVVGADLLEKLDKPANSYRDPKLVNLTSAEVKKLTIKRGDETLEFVKNDQNWKMVQPKEMPAETTDVDDVLFAVTGLRAADWVAEDQKNARQYEIDHPRIAVTLSATTQPVTASTKPAATMPLASGATTQPVTIRIGRYDDVLKKNVIVASSAVPAVAKVPASIIDSLSKKPIEFRDKRVVQIDPNQVSEISILGDIAATTQPTTKPASKKEVVIQRHHETLPVGIAAPTTGPATKPVASATTKPATQASTSPATEPALAATQPTIKWEIMTATGEKKPAEESKVDDLLAQLNPLRAEKYLESAPTTQPMATWTVKVATQGPGGSPVNQYAITVTDPGSGKTPIATYNDLTFEVSRTLVEKLEGDFNKGAVSATPKSPVNETFTETPR